MGLGSFILISIMLVISLHMIIQSKRIGGIPGYIKYPIYFLAWITLLSNIGITDSSLFKSIINWSYLVGAGGLGDAVELQRRVVLVVGASALSRSHRHLGGDAGERRRLRLGADLRDLAEEGGLGLGRRRSCRSCRSNRRHAVRRYLRGGRHESGRSGGT